ncbi:MAG: M15 family metallopeptidase [Acidimicrobiales bacterium]
MPLEPGDAPAPSEPQRMGSTRQHDRRLRPPRRLWLRRAVAVAGVGVATLIVVPVALETLDSIGTPTSSPVTSSTAAGVQPIDEDEAGQVRVDLPATDRDPMSPLVLVNNQTPLPPGWEPPDLVMPNVLFTFASDDPKRLLRQPAATALESLMAAAARDGAPLAAVSGYRSAARQDEIFQSAVARFGAVEAQHRSARPGHSEHQTGLAIDVTSADGSCPAEACFAQSPAAAWIAVHAADHGFILRYPAGKEAVTGYTHEPWHLRYVGPQPAGVLLERGLTLEELPAR